ncbi:hypothetical protein ACGFJ7_42165 [Actinoplanes sp. NPDC048988]|uniref:hypothetical protein n=1 Tax=Actinoplanes sp. NPDC048988 TaxID=3363901 RepID=UPI00370F83A9
MDQREWDYGARMSRDRRAADSWATRSPDSPDFAEPEQKWSSLTDTGSMQPSAEALDWQRRADAWAQQAESDQSESVEPASRWSDVASTGRTTFPADGVGWRTETAEWRATGARWKQTTEWRSTTGSHGWRSTTEAWQTGGRGEYPPAAETPASQPAISSTAWSSSTDEPSADAGARPAWQQFTEPDRQDPPSWQRSNPSWQESSSWQQPSPRTPAESSSSWQRDAIEGTWNDTGSTTDASWLRSDDSRDDGRHLVREDDRAAWRRGAQQTPGPVGRRRAPEPGPTGGSGWSTGRSENDTWDTDNWAGHTDTGNIQLYGDPGTSTTSSWRADERSLPSAPYESTRPSRYDETPGYASETPAPRSRRERGPRYADDDTTGRSASGGVSGLADSATSYPPETRSARRARAAQPVDRERDETATFGAVPMDQGGMPAPGQPPRDDPRRGEPRRGGPRQAPKARYNPGTADWREQTASWEAEPDTSSWTRDPDTGQWSRSEDDPRILAWRREAARREAMGEGPRALPAAPAEAEENGQAFEPPARHTPPSLPPASAPRSGTPYGYGAAPSSATPSSALPSRGGYPEAPRRPYEDAPESAASYNDARSGTPYGRAGYPNDPAPTGRPFDEPSSAPRSAMPYGSAASAPGRRGYLDDPAPTDRRSYDDPASAPRSATPYSSAAPAPGRRGYPDDPAPTDRRSYDDPGSAPRSGVPYGAFGGTAPRSTPPSSAPRSAPSYGAAPAGGYPDRYSDTDTPRYSSSAPASGFPAESQRSLPPAPARSDAPPPYEGRLSGYSSSAPASGLPRYSPEVPPGGAPRYSPAGDLPADIRRPVDDIGGQTTRYPSADLGGSPRYPTPAPSSGLPSTTPRYSGTAPASGPPTTPRYSSTAPASGPPSAPRYSSTAPASGLPAIAPRYSSTAPASGLPAERAEWADKAERTGWSETAGTAESPYGAGRRRADDQEPPTRRGMLDPTAYAQEPLSSDAWRRDSSPQPGSGDAPWSPGGTTESRPRPEPGAWRNAEREERAKGSASYRDGGGNDWRRDLAEQSDLAEGESRRYGTSDYVPFRSSGSAAVEGTSNLSMTSTSLISPVPREQREAYQGLSGSYERRPVTGGYPTIRKNDLLDPDDEEDAGESGGPLAAVGYTLVWYGVPVVLFVVYMVVFGADSQTHALDTLSKAAPQFGISLVLSVLVAVGLRFISHSWKAISVGLAAAVVGGGLATVLTSAITGNSLS